MHRTFFLTICVALAGCASQAKFIASRQDLAMQTALSRARFEMNCPQADGTLLSTDVTQPAVNGPYRIGVQRAEYTIGVSGCGKRETVVVLCPQGGTGCFAADRDQLGPAAQRLGL